VSFIGTDITADLHGMQQCADLGVLACEFCAYNLKLFPPLFGRVMFDPYFSVCLSVKKITRIVTGSIPRSSRPY